MKFDSALGFQINFTFLKKPKRVKIRVDVIFSLHIRLFKDMVPCWMRNCNGISPVSISYKGAFFIGGKEKKKKKTIGEWVKKEIGPWRLTSWKGIKVRIYLFYSSYNCNKLAGYQKFVPPK